MAGRQNVRASCPKDIILKIFPNPSLTLLYASLWSGVTNLWVQIEKNTALQRAFILVFVGKRSGYEYI